MPVTKQAVADQRRGAAYTHIESVTRAAVEAGQAEIVHLHGIDFASYIPNAGVPTLVTLHLPRDWYDPVALIPQRPNMWLLPVSASQACQVPAGTALLPPIANGVDCTLFRPTDNKQDYALVLGRVAPEKGFHVAFDAAR